MAKLFFPTETDRRKLAANISASGSGTGETLANLNTGTFTKELIGTMTY